MGFRTVPVTANVAHWLSNDLIFFVICPDGTRVWSVPRQIKITGDGRRLMIRKRIGRLYSVTVFPITQISLFSFQHLVSFVILAIIFAARRNNSDDAVQFMGSLVTRLTQLFQ
jgi:hypothetical protein